MPYKLRKAPNRELYWVVTIETGKKHSKDPIPKDKAKAQKRILEQALRGGADDGDDAEIAALMAGLNVQEPVLFAPAPANFQLPVGMFEPAPRPPRRRKAPKRAISTVQGQQVVSAQKRQKIAGQGKKLKGGITSKQLQTINDKYVNDQLSNDELAEQWNEVFALLTESQKQHVNKVWGRENMVQMLTAEINEIIAESHNPNFGIYGSEINVTATLSNIRNILRGIYRIILKLLEDTEFTNERVAFKPQQARGQGKLKGAGSGKWTALIKSLAQMYNIPQKIVDYTITANDKLTGSKRFDAKRNNILTQFRDYLNPTVVDEISELEDGTVAEYAKTIDGRRTILNLREVQTTNPLALKGQGKVTQRRIAALKTQIDALTPKFNNYVQQVEAFSKRTGQSLDEIYKTPSGKKILALEEKINNLVEKYNYWVSVEKGEASVIPEEEEEVPEPTNRSARSSGLAAVRMLRKGKGKCRCNAR